MDAAPNAQQFNLYTSNLRLVNASKILLVILILVEWLPPLRPQKVTIYVL